MWCFGIYFSMVWKTFEISIGRKNSIEFRLKVHVLYWQKGTFMDEKYIALQLRRLVH